MFAFPLKAKLPAACRWRLRSIKSDLCFRGMHSFDLCSGSKRTGEWWREKRASLLSIFTLWNQEFVPVYLPLKCLYTELMVRSTWVWYLTGSVISPHPAVCGANNADKSEFNPAFFWWYRSFITVYIPTFQVIWFHLFIYLFICTAKKQKQLNNNKRESDCAGEIRKPQETNKRISPKHGLQKQIQNPTTSTNKYK